jgi:hypothetical protein
MCDNLSPKRFPRGHLTQIKKIRPPASDTLLPYKVWHVKIELFGSSRQRAAVISLLSLARARQSSNYSASAENSFANSYLFCGISFSRRQQRQQKCRHRLFACHDKALLQFPRQPDSRPNFSVSDYFGADSANSGNGNVETNNQSKSESLEERTQDKKKQFCFLKRLFYTKKQSIKVEQLGF